MTDCTFWFTVALWGSTVYEAAFALLWVAILAAFIHVMIKEEKRWTIGAYILAAFSSEAIATHFFTMLNPWVSQTTLPLILTSTFMTTIAPTSALLVLIGLPFLKIVSPYQINRDIENLNISNYDENKRAEILQDYINEMRNTDTSHLNEVMDILKGLVRTNTRNPMISLHLETCVKDLITTQVELGQNMWKGVALWEIMDRQIKAFGLKEVFALRGPDVLLTPNHAQMFSLAIFEMGLNASQHIKSYGNILQGTIEWRIYPKERNLILELHWHEDTKFIDVNVKKGLGADILGRIVPTAFGGDKASSKLTITPKTVDWDFIGLLS